MKYCENIVVTFDCDFFILFPFFPCIHTDHTLLFIFFLFFILLFLLLHTRIPIPIPTLLKSHLVFIFLELLLHTTCLLTPLYFYFSFFISSSLFLILSLIHSLYHTHITDGEQSQNLKLWCWRWQWQNLKLALPKRRVSEERKLCDVLWREQNLKLFCFLFYFYLGLDSKGSRELWEAVWSRFSKPWGLIAVRTGPCFFPIKRFLRLKELQKWAVQDFPDQTIRSSPGFKTMITSKVRFVKELANSILTYVPNIKSHMS